MKLEDRKGFYNPMNKNLEVICEKQEYMHAKQKIRERNCAVIILKVQLSVLKIVISDFNRGQSKINIFHVLRKHCLMNIDAYQYYKGGGVEMYKHW